MSDLEVIAALLTFLSLLYGALILYLLNKVHSLEETLDDRVRKGDKP
jgi:hypothetical protein